MSPEEEPEYRTPPTCELLGLLLKNRRPTGAVNEVWPDLYIGNAATAQDKSLLAGLGVTHVVNAADGPRRISTGPRFYEGTGIRYHGVEAADCRDFDLSPFFTETADFIHAALERKGTSAPLESRQTKMAHSAGLYCGSFHNARCWSTVHEESAARRLWHWPSS
ncbi:dual specificity phosphatase 29 isoform X2 [Gasterosteus aculeatus]